MVLPVLPIMAVLLKAQLGMNIGLSADIKIGYGNAGIKTPLSAGLGILVRHYLFKYFIGVPIHYNMALLSMKPLMSQFHIVTRHLCRHRYF